MMMAKRRAEENLVRNHDHLAWTTESYVTNMARQNSKLNRL